MPGAAESWEYNDDATQITFHLRPDLKYSDGSPLTAENFRYAVERTCDPDTAGEYQSILFEIIGCAEFAGLALDADGNAQEYTPEEYEAARAALGVRALDDLTLQLDLTNPAPYLPHHCVTLGLLPGQERDRGRRTRTTGGRRAENHIGNGPFTVTGIAEDQQLDLRRQRQLLAGPAQARRHRVPSMSTTPPWPSRPIAPATSISSNCEPPQIPEVKADPELSEAFVTYPQAVDLQSWP